MRIIPSNMHHVGSPIHSSKANSVLKREPPIPTPHIAQAPSASTCRLPALPPSFQNLFSESECTTTRSPPARVRAARKPNPAGSKGQYTLRLVRPQKNPVGIRPHGCPAGPRHINQPRAGRMRCPCSLSTSGMVLVYDAALYALHPLLNRTPPAAGGPVLPFPPSDAPVLGEIGRCMVDPLSLILRRIGGGGCVGGLCWSAGDPRRAF
jgi:hypothetical protein